MDSGDPPASDGSAAELESFAFVHAGLRLAVDLISVARVLRALRLTSRPSGPEYLRQAIYDAGAMVPVADLALLLGFGSAPHAEEERVILLASGDARLGVTAQEVLGPILIDRRSLRAPSSNVDRRIARCVRGVAHDGVVVLDGLSLPRRLAPDAG